MLRTRSADRDSVSFDARYGSGDSCRPRMLEHIAPRQRVGAQLGQNVKQHRARDGHKKFVLTKTMEC